MLASGPTGAHGDSTGRRLARASEVGGPSATLALTPVDPAHYVILREIARGGMGRVLVARDRRLGREVALKEVLVPGGPAAQRFEREVRITARLQHPSIISVHEAGTWPSGEAFYAMRHVTGRSLDEVIAAARTPAERLALLPHVLAIADAMAYAHGQRVIHRDLKPRNVVVGEFGETVVIDWGIAKDLAAATDSDGGHTTAPDAAQSLSVADDLGGGSEVTTFGEVLGTPAYMPLEQASGAPVDERADVYAIGAILYHLLAGRAPYVAASHVELISLVHEGPPPALASLVPDAPRELVAITERAMARDLAARYPTARALAEDLRRFQTGQLVGAHRYSLRQLLRRWLRKHRTVLAAVGAAVVAAIVIGVVAVRRVIAAEALAEDERQEALARRADAESLTQFMLGDLQQKLSEIGRLELLDTVARRASEYYEARFATGSDDDRYFAAIAQLSVGRVVQARGQLREALSYFEGAHARLSALASAHPEVVRYGRDARRAARYSADIHWYLGDIAAANVAYTDLLAQTQAAVAGHTPSAEEQHELTRAENSVGDCLERQGEHAAALLHYRAALTAAEAAAALGASPQTDLDLVNAHANIAGVLAQGDRHVPAALAEYRVALAIDERVVAASPKDPKWLRDAATSHDEIGQLLARQHDLAGALVEYRAGRDLAVRAVAIDPSDTNNLLSEALFADRIGRALADQKDLVGARAELVAADAVWANLLARDPDNTEWLRDKSILDNELGDVELAGKHVDAALERYAAALAIRLRVLAKAPDDPKARRDVFYSHWKRASVWKAAAERPRTPAHTHWIEELRAAIAVADITHADHPTNQTFADDAAEAHAELGIALGQDGDAAGGAAELRAAIAIGEAMRGRPDASAEWPELLRQMRVELAKLTSR